MSENVAGFPSVKVTRKTGSEKFYSGATMLDLTLLDFWQWSASDLVSNATRGILAEYIVANALGLADGVREEWKACDLCTKDEIKIEVKSAAYLQSWHQKKLSGITFGIRPTRRWDSSTNEYAAEPIRQADIYIFCLLNHRDKDSLDPLNLDQWDFYILRASVLDEKFLTRKTIGLASLLELKPYIAKYEEIAGFIETLSGEIKPLENHSMQPTKNELVSHARLGANCTSLAAGNACR